jgi:hypothetical protein
VTAPSTAYAVPQPEWLPEHLHQIAGEIQREQQPGLLQRLEPMVPSYAHQKLKPRPMPLPRRHECG